MKSTWRRLELVERKPLELAQDDLDIRKALAIRAAAKDRVSIEVPDGVNRHTWRLTSDGWVGQIPVTEDLLLVLNPKVSVENLFRMIEVAYQIPVDFPEGPSATNGELSDLFDRLARLLARKILLRLRRGLHREYIRYEEALPFVRGSLDVLDFVRRGPSPLVHCRFEEQTPDIADNRILHWTVRCILRSLALSEETRDLLAQASRSLRGAITLEPYQGTHCRGRFYTRLNADYEAMHGLCRFFLDAVGPKHASGGAAMIPFMVNMDKLFEAFVAKWSSERFAGRFDVEEQAVLKVGENSELSVKADLLFKDSQSGKAVAVLDTKYKGSGAPAPEDIAQVNLYADVFGVSQAFLVYPSSSLSPFGVDIRDTRVSSLSFDLSGEFHAAGEAFARDLMVMLDARRSDVA